MKNLFALVLFTLSVFPNSSRAQAPVGERMLESYFATRTAEIRANCLAPFRSLDSWKAAKPTLKKQLREMLGLDPWPERSSLQAVTTGILDQADIRVEKLHFQSLPGLYVTANLYLPKQIAAPLPTILYVCGHAIAKDGNRSFGNKAAYQHHGIWFAQHGYACLIIDTIHRGEIEGIHHGTYQYGMWWWNSRGYSSAGIEAWNSIRALDYLETRSEVDPNRIGITGRSGGGIYSWWAAALDERIKVAVPVAGMTDLQNQVVDDVVDGHCDCMFMVNTYRWDYPQVAALLAPRPLLIANSDKDSIFPLDGVVRLHSKVRDIYQLYDAEDHLGLLITEGPHKDTQDLQVPTFRWFNRFLKSKHAPISKPATKWFPNKALAVFESIPETEINRSIQETFVPRAPEPQIPENTTEWQSMTRTWLQELREKSFRSWPALEQSPVSRKVLSHRIQGGKLEHYAVTVQQRVQLPMYVYLPDRTDLVEKLELEVLDETNGETFHAKFKAAIQSRSIPSFLMNRSTNTAYAWIAPRGIGPTAWNNDAKRQTQVRRRFMLLGETLDSIRVFDIIRSTQSASKLSSLGRTKITLKAQGTMGVNALYASLFLKSITGLELTELPPSHRPGPDYLNVSRIWSLPQALAASLENRSIILTQTPLGLTEFAKRVQEALGWDSTLAVN